MRPWFPRLWVDLAVNVEGREGEAMAQSEDTGGAARSWGSYERNAAAALVSLYIMASQLQPPIPELLFTSAVTLCDPWVNF